MTTKRHNSEISQTDEHRPMKKYKQFVEGINVDDWHKEKTDLFLKFKNEIIFCLSILDKSISIDDKPINFELFSLVQQMMELIQEFFHERNNIFRVADKLWGCLDLFQQQYKFTQNKTTLSF